MNATMNVNKASLMRAYNLARLSRVFEPGRLNRAFGLVQRNTTVQYRPGHLDIRAAQGLDFHLVTLDRDCDCVDYAEHMRPDPLTRLQPARRWWCKHRIAVALLRKAKLLERRL